jgi:CBS-domain-containing membrane protein
VATLRALLGVELDEVSWREKTISAAGGAVSIMAILLVTHHLLGLSGAPMLVASMGASAVLLFAVPHGALSQPWPLVGGHFTSAVIGVTCARYLGSIELAAACAVGLSIGVMHQFKSIHPPGGATALTAVMGGPAVHDLGYSFVWRPVMVNVAVILAVGVIFNLPFAWRRYPVYLTRRRTAVVEASELSHGDVVEALRSIDSFIDITEDDLRRLLHILSSRRSHR